METDTIFLWDDKKTIMIDHTQLVVIYLQFGPVYSRSLTQEKTTVLKLGKSPT